MNEHQNSKLLFVYNADSGLSNALLDYGKKYLSPSKYDCRLCMLSYGPFGMRKDWKQFVASLPYDAEFLHKDDFAKRYPLEGFSFPAVLVLKDEKIEVLVSSEEFKSIATLTALIDTVKSKLTTSLGTFAS